MTEAAITLERYALEETLALANEIQDRVLSFHPDLVLALAHGAWGPLRAVRALWKATQSNDFPPVAVTNIGREKFERFRRVTQPVTERTGLVSGFAGPEDVKRLRTWLSGETIWLDELRGQVNEVLGAGVRPERILIIDETYVVGKAFYISQGLLGALYPDTQVRFIAGEGFEWRSRVTREWLRAFDDGWTELDWKTVLRGIYTIVPGTEDVDPDSLAWQPIAAGSPLLPPLERYLPAEAWLKISPAILGAIEAYVRQNADADLHAYDVGLQIKVL